MLRPWLRAVLAVTALTIAWRPGWLPGDPVTPGDEIVPVWAIPTRAVPGAVIALDPVTGRPVTPTLEQLRRLNAARMLAAPARPLRVERLPQGGVILRSNGAFRFYSVARIGPDGRVVTDCVSAPAK